MTDTKKDMKALVLFSGGLDSTIALKLLKDQGLDTYAVYVETGFVNADYDFLKEIAEKQIGAKLVLLMRHKQYVDKVLFTPKYGYGRFFNPCLDCHKFMIETTWEWALEEYGKGNFFLATGEVLNQRGKSQTRANIDRMNKDLGEILDWLVRPLSIKHFPQTMPEKLGIINPDNLLNLSGKQRSRQLALIEELGIKGYQTPAGGCLLTVRGFADRLKKYSSVYKYTPEDFKIVRHGRHFWFDDKLLVMSRNEKETKLLASVDNHPYLMKLEAPEPVIGPIALIDKTADDRLIREAAGLLLDYSKCDKEAQYTFVVNGKTYEGIKAVDRQKHADKLITG